MLTQRLLGAVTVSALLGLTACATDPTTERATRTTTSVPADDVTLNESVSNAVHGIPGLNMNDLNISTHNGVVTLTGRTATRTQAQDAIEAARHVPGVQKVDYDIDVDQP